MTPQSTPTTARTHRTRRAAAAVSLAGLLALTACGQDSPDDGDPNTLQMPAATEGQTEVSPAPGAGAESPGADTESPDDATASPDQTAMDAAAFTATLQDGDGTEVGTAEFREAEGALEITVQASGMDPGFYGLHVHGIGECEPDSAAPDDPSDTGDFMSAGGHIGAEESEHPDHPGDLPALLVQESGGAHLMFHTDRLSAEDFEDEDGAAMMIHSDPDNYANIPDRYSSEGPDEDTLTTGDAGSRLACGVVESGS